MRSGYRIGVIAPHLEGEYYGRLLTFIHERAREMHAQIIAVQTADDYLGFTDLEEPVSFHLVDAWILILPAASAAFLELLFRSGKPVVCLGFPSPSEHGVPVLINNREGMKEAVLHLIDHGHRRIVYIGNTAQYDLEERRIGYAEALAERGIPYDEAMVARIADNIMEGGADGIAALLDRGISFTAVAAGTDLNAFGAIQVLRERGLRVPEDVAVVAFDDIQSAETHEPPLTTVRQSFRKLAREACDVVFDRLQGGAARSGETRMVSGSLRVRESCGCRNADAYDEQERRELRSNLSFLRKTVHRLTIDTYELLNGLFKATEMGSIDVNKMFWNRQHWGCLALWENDPSGERQLVIRQTFSRRGDPLPPIGTAMRLEHFPPVEYLPPSAGPDGEDIVIVHSIKSTLRDWGYMVLAGPIDPDTHLITNDLSLQGFTILAVALEQEMLFGQLQTMNEKLEVVMRSTSDGVYDLDLQTGNIEWSIGADSVAKREELSIGAGSEAFWEALHPEDRPRVSEKFSPPYPEDGRIRMEYRLAGRHGRDIWLDTTGEVMRDGEGTPVRIIGSITDITEKKEYEARMLHMAYHDSLTGLFNRQYFQERLHEAIRKHAGSEARLAVLLIDLDRFKFINDTLGHQWGDDLLCRVAERMRACLRENAVIARLGGDEFIVLLPGVQDEAEAIEGAEALLTHLKPAVGMEGQDLFVSASIGVSLFPDHGGDAETLVKHADLAMYRAKGKGGNDVALYTPSLSYANDIRFNLEKEMRRAIEQDEFTLAYQPQIAMDTGEIFGAEALIRWETPDGRRISPGEFIPLAEESGLIIPIGQWVLERACSQAAKWEEAGIAPALSVNISALQFRSDGFPAEVRDVLQRTGLDPRRLCLEITEYTAVQDLEHSSRMLKELEALGVRIAIDDFGIGHSPLVLLKKFPAHMVKIDPSFIREMMESRGDEAIVRSVIAMAHSMGLRVTAEGVETPEQLEKLKGMKCDRIQGYYTGRPMPSDAFVAYAEEARRGNLSYQSIL